MIDWRVIVNKTKMLLKSDHIVEAKQELLAGLEKAPHQFNLLHTATQVFRASGDRERSLEFAQLIIVHYPRKSQGYKLAAQDLISLKRFDEAQDQINAGLEKNPRQFNLLSVATTIHRAKKEYTKSLKYAKLLITHHPDQWKGYGLAAQDLVALKRYKEAVKEINTGLEKFPHQVNLLNIATQIFLKAGDFEKSLEHAHKVHHQDGMLSRSTFDDLLTYVANQEDDNKTNRPSDATIAIDYYFNSRFILSSRIMPFNFIYAPKNACSSIKLSLLSRYTNKDANIIKQNPHQLANELIKQKIDWSKQNFCLVRNPYARFISAFTDKCRPGGDRSVWPPLCKRYGFDETKQISMDTLLDALLDDDHNRIDVHLRPQYKVLCSSAITPHKIFYMEQMKDLILFLGSHDTELLRHAPHATKAKAIKPSELDDRIVEKLKKLYSKDFAHYGYSEDPKSSQIAHQASSPCVSDLLVKSNASMSSSSQLKALDSLLFMNPILKSASSLEILCANAYRRSQ